MTNSSDFLAGSMTSDFAYSIRVAREENIISPHCAWSKNKSSVENMRLFRVLFLGLVIEQVLFVFWELFDWKWLFTVSFLLHFWTWIGWGRWRNCCIRTRYVQPGDELNDPYGSLPTQGILWIYDSVIQINLTGKLFNSMSLIWNMGFW